MGHLSALCAVLVHSVGALACMVFGAAVGVCGCFGFR